MSSPTVPTIYTYSLNAARHGHFFLPVQPPGNDITWHQYHRRFDVKNGSYTLTLVAGSGVRSIGKISFPGGTPSCITINGNSLTDNSATVEGPWEFHVDIEGENNEKLSFDPKIYNDGLPGDPPPVA